MPASVDGIVQGLLLLLKNRIDLKTKGANIRKFICENFLWDIIIKKYLKFYEQILKTK